MLATSHRGRARTLALLAALLACWLLAPVAPATAVTAGPPAAVTAPAPSAEPAMTVAGPAVLAGTEPTEPAGDDPADRELVAGLVAIGLLAVTIALHAMARDRR